MKEVFSWSSKAIRIWLLSGKPFIKENKDVDNIVYKDIDVPQ